MVIVVVKGELPGVQKQAGGLFMDNLGHATKPLRDMASYSKLTALTDKSRQLLMYSQCGLRHW
jgi:hypothetical protein